MKNKSSRLIKLVMSMLLVLICFLVLGKDVAFAKNKKATNEKITFSYKGYEFEVIDKKNFEVKLIGLDYEKCKKKYKGMDREYLLIPELVKYKKKEYTVTTLGTESLKNAYGEVRMPDSITNIEKRALGLNITDLYFSNSIKELPKKLFVVNEVDTKLSYVSLPNKLIEIPGKAFYDCVELQGIVLPKSIKKIGSRAFRKGVKVVYLLGKVPENITKISGLMQGTIFYINEAYEKDLTKALSDRIKLNEATVRTYKKGFNGDYRNILINPWNYLPKDYNPKIVKFYSGQINDKIFDIATQMFDDAKKDGIKLILNSGYRSKATQTYLFEKKVKSYTDVGYSRSNAEKKAATTTARPDTSEHQTGYALDIVSDEYQSMAAKFALTKAYKWLCQNAYKYGFIMRYPDDKIDVTGIIFEPWHYRFVGVDVALEMKNKDICYEEWHQINSKFNPSTK